MTYSFNYATNAADALYVAEGDYVQFRFKAPSEWSTRITVQVNIGLLPTYWVIETRNEDRQPNPFPFQIYEGAEIDTLYTYADGLRSGEEPITIGGLTDDTVINFSISYSRNIPNLNDPAVVRNYAAFRIDYNGDGTWDTNASTDGNGWYPSTFQSATVTNGSKVQVRARSADFEDTPARLSVSAGTTTEEWTIRTVFAPTNVPEPFPEFADKLDQPNNVYVYTDEVIQISGLIASGSIQLDNGGQFALSSSPTTFTNADGYQQLDVPDSAWTSNSTVVNGQYLQLRRLSDMGNSSSVSMRLDIADDIDGSDWRVGTEGAPDTNPNEFSFDPKTNVLPSTEIPSDPEPSGGISGLDAGVVVPVVLVTTPADRTTSSNVRIKINDGSIGTFPAFVQNGDIITLYVTSADTVSTTVQATIKVGGNELLPFQVRTYDGPDSVAKFDTPQNIDQQLPFSYVSSPFVQIDRDSINVPIQISTTNGALISIDSDAPTNGDVPGSFTRTFDPLINSYFYVSVLTGSIGEIVTDTTVTVGTGSGENNNNPFTWSAETRLNPPVITEQQGIWYSIKTPKFEGYNLGTILPILKEDIGSYGNLDGSLSSRYPGFIKCEGQSLEASKYWQLWEIIGNHYGGNATVTNENIFDGGILIGTTRTYSGNFNIPDYRNRKMCGVGVVDALKGNSAFLPVDTSGAPQQSDIQVPGSEGGYWYFDKVDSFGANPLEQIQGTGVTGLNSQFFSLGTVRLRGLETLVDSVSFNIPSSCEVNATIGPLENKIVAVPSHDHFYVAAVPGAEDGFPLIRWGNVFGGRSMFQTGKGTWTVSKAGVAGSDTEQANLGYIAVFKDSEGTNSAYEAESSSASALAADSWLKFWQGYGSFEQNLRMYYGDNYSGSLEEWISDNGFPTGFPVVPDPMQDGDSVRSFDAWPGDFAGQTEYRNITFTTWWVSDRNQLPSATSATAANAASGSLRPTTSVVYNATSGGGVNNNSVFTPGNAGAWENGMGINFACAGVCDIRTDSFTVDPFNPAGGITLPHSHLITTQTIGDINQDFTGGNLTGAGTTADNYGSGLGGGVEGAVTAFQGWESFDLNTYDTIGTGADGTKYANQTLGEYWGRQLGTEVWAGLAATYGLASAFDVATYVDIETETINQTGGGSGLKLLIDIEPYPNEAGTVAANTRIRVKSVINAGSGYNVGDQVQMVAWNDFCDVSNSYGGGGSDKMLRISNVSSAGDNSAATEVNLKFNQNEIFMDMTEAEFKFTSSFKKPVPDVTMRPQRQVPIMNPFHKTKYIIKAW